MNKFKYYSIISGLFSATLVISNTLDTKIFMVGSFAMPAGIILFPIAYLFGDILTEVYGYTASRKVIWTGFCSLILMVITYEIAGKIQPASFWLYQTDFEHILGKVPRIVIAGITAYFCGEFVNSYILAKLKIKTKGKGMSIRFILSTLIGQFVDTSVFVVIAFAGSMIFSELTIVTLSAWIFKVSWEIIALPATLPFVKWLKKAEQEDYFDTHTNFNPFKLN
jgi:queuosine precursor transporter